MVSFTSKQEVEQKSGFATLSLFFTLVFKWSEKTAFEQKFAFRVVFLSRASI